MTNLSTLENKISAVKKYLNILERYKKYFFDEIKNNIDIQGALERYLRLVVQATIDLADYSYFFKKLSQANYFE